MKKYSILGLVLIMSITLALSGCGLFEAPGSGSKDPAKIFTTGTGQESDPYIVSTREQVDAVRYDLDACYKLEADIDLDEYTMEPIGTETSPFTGEFDGNGHTLNYLDLSVSEESYEGVGLFGCLRGAKIENLTVDKISAPDLAKIKNLGILAGIAASDSIIENCTVKGEMNGYNNIGGLVGKLSSRSIARNCRMDIILSGNEHTGGITGECLDSTIENCSVEGDITCRSTYPGRSWAGGFVGNMISGEIKNSYSLATVEVTDSASFAMYNGTAGGLIGNFQAGKMSFCYVSGEVSGYHNPGGVYGNWDNGEFEQVINNTDGTGLIANGSADFIKTEGSPLDDDYVVIRPSGIYGYNSAQMKTPSLFSEWDQDIWDISEDYYPRFK